MWRERRQAEAESVLPLHSQRDGSPKEHISALLRAKNAFLGKGGGRQSDGHAPRFGIRLCRVGKQADGDAGRSRPCYQKRDVIGLFRAFLHGGHAIGEGLCVMLAGDLNA